MDDHIEKIGSANPSWRERLRHVLTHSGRAMSEVLAPGNPVGNIDAELIKKSETRLCARVTVGTQTGFLKIFDANDDATCEGFQRERDVLSTMRDSGLVPRLRAASEQYRWMLMEDIPDAAQDPAATLPRMEFARRAGEWIARFEATAPFERATGNWLGYITKLGLSQHLSNISGAAETLAQIPLCGAVLARNDAALHNYLLGPDKTLLGCDFESVTLKPRGWEYVNTWQSILQRFGDDGDKAIEAFSDGFGSAHKGGLLMDELNAVARILFCARFLAAQQQRRAA